MSADTKDRNDVTARAVADLISKVETQRLALDGLRAQATTQAKDVARLAGEVSALRGRLEALEGRCKDSAPVAAPTTPVDAEIRIATGTSAP